MILIINLNTLVFFPKAIYLGVLFMEIIASIMLLLVVLHVDFRLPSVWIEMKVLFTLKILDGKYAFGTLWERGAFYVRVVGSNGFPEQYHDIVPFNSEGESSIGTAQSEINDKYWRYQTCFYYIMKLINRLEYRSLDRLSWPLVQSLIGSIYSVLEQSEFHMAVIRRKLIHLAYNSLCRSWFKVIHCSCPFFGSGSSRSPRSHS